MDGKMYALKRDGSLLWSYQTDGAIAEAAPALGADGTLYFSSDDGYVYAIQD
jgi:outer membrane protein assembly factor BamB